LKKALARRNPRQNRKMTGLEEACVVAKKTSSMWPFTHCTSSKGHAEIYAGIKIIMVKQRPKIPSHPMR